MLENAGWDVEPDGLVGAPRVRVIGGAERHATIDRSLRLLGLGTARVVPVDSDAQGAIDVAGLRRRWTPSRRPHHRVPAGRQREHRRVRRLAAAIPWRTSGAPGCTSTVRSGSGPRPARGTPQQVRGVEQADSWATDAHKWLNVPYDSGLAIVARRAGTRATMAYTADYLAGSGRADFSLGDLVPDSSRRARGFAVWAALRELGRSGVADLVDRCCTLAGRMADRLRDGGATIHNEVGLNQVLVGFGDLTRTDAVIEEVQRDGTCWLGGTTWHGHRLIRVSVSNGSTTEADIDRSAEAILAAAHRVGAL